MLIKEAWSKSRRGRIIEFFSQVSLLSQFIDILAVCEEVLEFPVTKFAY